MRSIHLLYLLILFSLSACVSLSGPSPQELAQADYGKPISQEAAQHMALAYFQQRVEKPESTQYNYSAVQADWLRDPQIENGTTIYGYSMIVVINSKNSLGRYASAMAYKLMFRDGHLVHVVNQPKLSNDVTYMGKIY